jgi:hypothetical protein
MYAKNGDATRSAGRGCFLMFFKTWQQQPQQQHILAIFLEKLG